MKRLFLGLEIFGLIGGTLAALAGDIDVAIMLWLVSIYMAVRSEK